MINKDFWSAVNTQFGDKGKTYAKDKYVQDQIVNPNLTNFGDAAKTYSGLIDTNTGKTGANTSYTWGKDKGENQTTNSFNTGLANGSKIQDNALNYAKQQTNGMANKLTAVQSGGAASQALGNAVSSGMTRGRASMDAGNAAANAFTNNYANNYNTQLGQQNNLMNAYTGNVTGQQSVYNNNLNNQQNFMGQQLANQINTTGTLMGAHLSGDQARYQQNIENEKMGVLGKLGTGAKIPGLDDGGNGGNSGNNNTNNNTSHGGGPSEEDRKKMENAATGSVEFGPQGGGKDLKDPTWEANKGLQGSGSGSGSSGTPPQTVIKGTDSINPGDSSKKGPDGQGNDFGYNGMPSNVPSSAIQNPSGNDNKGPTNPGPGSGGTGGATPPTTVVKGPEDIGPSSANPYKGPSNIPSDNRLKNSMKVGLKDSDDLRMTHYKNCCNKIKYMNPNRWEELKWRMK